MGWGIAYKIINMKYNIKQISILTAVFFIPSALIVSGFFYWTISVFQEHIYSLDDSAIELADDIFGFDDEYSEDDFIDYVENTDEEVNDEQFDAYEQLLNELEEETYQSAIRSLMPVLYGVLFVVFLLSVVAAMMMIRPLRRALEQQKQFIADASHEIKTPLALMQSELDLFTKEHQNTDPDKSQTMSLIDNLQSDIKRLSGLATRLLVMARLDSKGPAGKTQQACEGRQIVSLIEKLKNRFNADDNRTILVQVDDVLSEVQVDCERLEQVLEILLENTCTHTPVGTKVTVICETNDKNLCVSVQDNGPGISRYHIEHIFDRFYRVDDSRNSKGNGLGLSIARELVKQDGGTITVTSGEGGTIFMVSYQLA